jgi:hypothetical protein
MDSRGPMKPCQVLTVLAGHRASPISHMHPLSSVPPIQVRASLVHQSLPLNLFFLKTLQWGQIVNSLKSTNHAMRTERKWNVQLTRATLGLWTRVVEGSFVAYQIASSFFRAGGVPWHSTRSCEHLIATAPGHECTVGRCSNFVSLPYPSTCRFGTPIVAAEPFLPQNPTMRTNSKFSKIYEPCNED